MIIMREKNVNIHEGYTKGLLYFVGNYPAIPDSLEKKCRNGLS